MNNLNHNEKKVNIIVDNASWVIPYAKKIVQFVNKENTTCLFVDKYELITEADVSFYLGCVNITPKEMLDKSKKNLVVHASDLPRGRGFSPLTWQILEGKNKIPVCLFEMTPEVDEGPIVYQEIIHFEGHELLSELQNILGNKIISLCLKYLNSKELPQATSQYGEPTYYKRRYPLNSKIETSNTIEEVFNVFRVADNERYPVYFEKEGFKYLLKIEKE